MTTSLTLGLLSGAAFILTCAAGICALGWALSARQERLSRERNRGLTKERDLLVDELEAAFDKMNAATELARTLAEEKSIAESAVSQLLQEREAYAEERKREQEGRMN